MKINIKIGELIVDGFEYIDQEQLTNALTMELIRLVRENGLPDNMIHEKSVQAIQTEPLNLEKNVSPTTIGLEVAKSIHRGWNNVSNY